MSKQKTWTAKAADLKGDWFVVDATDQVLGRLASSVAKILRGKHKPTFTPHLNTGDHVVVTNAVRGMLQRNTLGADMLKRLRVYAGPDHGHVAQKPKVVTFDSRGDIKIG